MEAILVAIITGSFSLIGVIITGRATVKKTREQVGKDISVSQAVTNTKLEELTREVREHNNFARRVPVMEEQIKVINHRIEDLEHAEKQ